MHSFIKREYDYAIRICAFLAGFKSGETVPLSKVARLLAIPRPFATKIVHKLKNNGITDAVQGKAGGIFLRKDPRKLSLLDILQAMGFNSTLNECLHEYGHCPLIKGCRIHLFFKMEEQKLLSDFADKKISELVIYSNEL